MNHNNKIFFLSKELNKNEPLNKEHPLNPELYKSTINLDKEEKKDLLVHSFKNFGRHYNYSLLLYLPILWIDFSCNDWKDIIDKMVVRYKMDFIFPKDIHTGYFSDLYFLNGIIGVSPFQYLFDNSDNTNNMNSFLIVIKQISALFFKNGHELIEDIVAFYDIRIFEHITSTKQVLLKGGFSPAFEKLEDLDGYLNGIKLD